MHDLSSERSSEPEPHLHPLSACRRLDRTLLATQVTLADDGYYMVDGSVVMQSGVFLAGL